MDGLTEILEAHRDHLLAREMRDLAIVRELANYPSAYALEKALKERGGENGLSRQAILKIRQRVDIAMTKRRLGC